MKKRLAWILWPAFMVAVPATGFVFSLLDPASVDFGGVVNHDRMAAYSLGFIFFWLIGACSSALTLLLLGDDSHSASFTGRRQ